MLLFRVFLTSGKVVVRIRPPMRSPKTRGHKGPIQKLSRKKYSTIVLNIGKPAEWERHGTGRLSENEKNERPVVVPTARPPNTGLFFKTAQFSAVLSHPIPTAKFEKWVGPICRSYMRCDFESEPTWNHFFRRRHEFDSSNYLFPYLSNGASPVASSRM